MELHEITDKHSASRLLTAGIPIRFHGKTFDNYNAKTPGQSRALTWACSYAGNVRHSPQSAILLGRPGTGKTHLAIAIAHDALLHTYAEQVYYTTVERAIRHRKESWSETPLRSPSQVNVEPHVRLDLTAPRLLILDEVGVQLGTQFEQVMLYEVINTRYENMKPTVLLSNLPLDELETYVGERVVDRLREDGGEVVVFDWESYRCE